MWGLLSVITRDSGQFEYDRGSVQTQDFSHPPNPIGLMSVVNKIVSLSM